VLRDRTVPTISRPDKEVLASRLLVAVSAACLLGVTALQLLDPGSVTISHPRNWAVAVVCCLLGLRIVAHAPRNTAGWMVLVMGVCSALAVGAQAWKTQFLAAWLGNFIWWPSYALLPVTILVFPNGRLLSVRWWPVMGVCLLGVLLPMVAFGWASWASPSTFWDVDALQGGGTRGLPVLLGAIGLLSFFLGLLGSLVSVVVRWLRAAGPERGLLVWSVGCTALLIPALSVETFSQTFSPAWAPWVVFAAAFPVSALIAILWYGLYDIDLLIHRSLLYGLLTVILTATYLLSVLVSTSSLPTQTNVVGTVTVVLLLAPVHRLLRGQVDRWLYGDRADPYRALTQLGERLVNPLPPDEVLLEVARSIANALKLPYVAINEGHRSVEPLATYGTSRQWPQLSVPLKQDGVLVGSMVVEARAPEEWFGRREQHLLNDLARQVALAVRSARLAADLQRASEEREEDLQHISTELHDAVGPSVAGVRLQADALRRTIDCAQTRSITKLDQIVDDLTKVSEDVRFLVRNVRPRELRAGLLHAVRLRAEQFEYPGFSVDVSPNNEFEQLPDAVERAAYRIVGEALNNIARYANASSCGIRLTRSADGLEVSVTDDGDGISPDAVVGKGLESMRRRCESRGGTFRIESLTPGTRVVAYLPFDEPVMRMSSA
jgi:two-component system, NarL family, sensor kinase